MSSEYVARAGTERGEVVLRRRDRDGALELRVNGVFVMDTAQTHTERLLARTTLDAVPTTPGGLTVLVGGLGLGFTLAEVLGDERVACVIVAEIEECLVQWHRDGLIPDSPVADPRVRIVTADVREVVARLRPGSLDLLLLDVDNGPDFLVYDINAAIYEGEFLTSCHDVTRPGGIVAVWSADTSDDLRAAMRAVFCDCDELKIPVTLAQRDTTYHLFLASR
ncbi:MAG: hypothetical protein ABJA81_01460 [Nocardioidaceae bacterium]